MNILVLLIILLLLCVIALLWYGVRTHKSVDELKAKVQDHIDGLSDQVQQEVAAALKAAQAKIDSGQK